MEIALLTVYALLLGIILAYSLVQLSLVWGYKRGSAQRAKMLAGVKPPEIWPMVTVQLPVFNERYVVERLIDAVANLDYPRSKLEIQVLDDGDDESVAIAAKRIAYWQAKGLDIKHIRREERVGFKAGALAYGLEQAKGEFTAVFDADFVPNRDFLKLTIPHFAPSKVGMVQTRWGHLNADYSLLTRLQAFGLDAHFTVEQGGRNLGHHFMNFNGTAGVWRKSCIQDSGGWQHDTITEDLDLSYRAQLKHWQFIFLEDVEAPAELPAEINALKNQQFRWTKGAAECAVKNLPAVLKHPSVSFGTKLHAVFHLLNSAIFIVVLLAALLSVPLLWVRVTDQRFDLAFNLATVILLSLFILLWFYRTSSKRMGYSAGRFFREFPLFLSVSMGMSLHNSIAVLEGYSGKKSAFVRTPKFAIDSKQGTWRDKVYRAASVSKLTLLEAALAGYFVIGILLGLTHGEFGLLPFHLMLAFGFGFVAVQSVRHTRSA